MRFILEFVEFAAILLTEPQSAAVAFRRFERQGHYALLSSGLASLALATAFFYTRSAYRLSYYILIPIVAGMILLFHRIYSRLMAARMLQHAVNHSTGSDAKEMSRTLSTLFEGAFLPGLFVLPLAITAQEFSVPAILLLPGGLGITGWILYIQYAGARYTLESAKRPTLMSLFRNHLMLMAFPPVAIYTGILLFISLIGLR